MISVARPSLGAEELRAVEEVFQSGWLGLGATTRAFEEALATMFGGRHVVAVNSGTAALHLALGGFGIGPGDEVLVPSLTFAACVQAIVACGATPVFCESDADGLCVDPADVARRISPRTKAVMPVHYGGVPCDLDALLALAERHGLRVIEDAAHAFGSTYRGRPVGSFGHAACFSFDPIKTITCGEGGAVVVADDAVADEIRRRRALGIDHDAWGRRQDDRPWFYQVTGDGLRYHMPNFCAAIGLAQLAKLDGFVRRRREVCRRYDAAFAGLAHVRVRRVDYAETVPHLYVVRVDADARDPFMTSLTGRGVGSGVHYIASHVHPHFARWVTEPLPVADRLWREIVSLPLHCELADADVDAVVDAVRAWDAERGQALRTNRDGGP